LSLVPRRGGTFGPIDDDYEGDDTTTSSATLALAGGAQDTSTNDGQDNTCVGIVGEDGAELAPMYEEEPSPVPAYDFYYEDEGSTLTDDNSGQLDMVGKRPLTLYDLEDLLLVTEDQVTQVLTRIDGACRFIEDLVWRAQMEDRHTEIVGGVTSCPVAHHHGGTRTNEVQITCSCLWTGTLLSSLQRTRTERLRSYIIS
jgi:hypothetical protein